MNLSDFYFKAIFLLALALIILGGFLISLGHLRFGEILNIWAFILLSLGVILYLISLKNEI